MEKFENIKNENISEKKDDFVIKNQKDEIDSKKIKESKDFFVKDSNGKIIAFENNDDIVLTNNDIGRAIDYAAERGIALANRKEAENLARKLIQKDFKDCIDSIDEDTSFQN